MAENYNYLMGPTINPGNHPDNNLPDGENYYTMEDMINPMANSMPPAPVKKGGKSHGRRNNR